MTTLSISANVATIGETTPTTARAHSTMAGATSHTGSRIACLSDWRVATRRNPMTDITPEALAAPVLAPCPFCGGEARFDDWEDDSQSNSFAGVRCKVCGVEMGFHVSWYEAVGEAFAKAAAAWNRRAPRVATADDADQLASALWARNELQHLAYSEIAPAVDCTLRPMGCEVRE